MGIFALRCGKALKYINLKYGLDDILKIEVYNCVEGGAYFERLLQEWRQRGLQVVYHGAITSEEYRTARGFFIRFTVRWKMYGAFAWQTWRSARRVSDEFCVRIATTNPFFTPALVAKYCARNGVTINLLYDLYPEALIQAGGTGPDSWLARRCEAITRCALRECAVTVFLGERLRAYTEAKYGSAQRAEVIPVGADDEPFRAFPPGPIEDKECPRILYCGQMGRMHDIDTLLGVWKIYTTVGFEWVFHAGGTGYARLKILACAPAGVTWGTPLHDDDWQVAMRKAHLALVTIAPGAERVVMPSKTYSALVAGQAILAICPFQSDLADLVYKHDCGWVVEPGDVAGLCAVLDELARFPAELYRRRVNAFKAGHEFYGAKVVAQQWMTLFESLISKQ